MNSNLCKKITTLERQCLTNNNYSRRQCLEIFGIPENIENKDLENLTLQIFEQIDISVHPENVEDCHWVKTQRSSYSDEKMLTRFVLKKKEAEG